MVIDFSFLKDEMMHHIDAPCDHGLIAAVSDIELLEMFCPRGEMFADWITNIERDVKNVGFCETVNTRLSSKIYVIEHQPTAECMAAHWFHRLVKPIHDRSDGVAVLTQIRVWETPNCYSDYINPDFSR